MYADLCAATATMVLDLGIVQVRKVWFVEHSNMVPTPES